MAVIAEKFFEKGDAVMTHDTLLYNTACYDLPVAPRGHFPRSIVNLRARFLMARVCRLSFAAILSADTPRAANDCSRSSSSTVQGRFSLNRTTPLPQRFGERPIAGEA